MTMRIAIDYTPAVQQSAGIGRYTRGLVSALAEVDQDNRYTLLVVAPRGEMAAFMAEERSKPFDLLQPRSAPDNFRFRLVSLPSRWLTIIWQRLRLPLPADLLSGAVDIYHCPDFVLPPLRDAAGIITVHDLAFLRVPECADPSLRRYLSAAVPRSLQRAKHVLADSGNTRQDLIELLNVAPKRISVVPAAVDQQFRRVEDPRLLREVRRRYSIDGPYILSTGTLEPRKNLARLIEAHARLRQRFQTAPPLFIAGGRGWLYEDVLESAQREGQDHVRLLGYVPDQHLPSLYSMAELFVFPSLYEGFGLPPLEAMACGTPVVCSNRPSLPEVVGDAALMVDPEDEDALCEAMQNVLVDPSTRQALSRKGLSQAQRFTWTQAAERLLEAYERAAL